MSSCKETFQLSSQAWTDPKGYSCSHIAVLWSQFSTGRLTILIDFFVLLSLSMQVLD
jgi:hypothetical protein